MKFVHLLFACVLCTPYSSVCSSSEAGSKSVESKSNEGLLNSSNSPTPTNFSSVVAASSMTITNLIALPGLTSVQQVFEMSTTDTALSSSVSDSVQSRKSTVGVATPTETGGSSTHTTNPATHHTMPTAIPPPATYSPPPSSVPTSTLTATSPTHPHTTQPSKTPVSPSGCAPPITVTVNTGPHCSNTPPPAVPCTSDCSAKIGLSLGISIPGTAILSFLVTALSCLCCQRVKRKQSYIQLAPTVYFDEEEHD